MTHHLGALTASPYRRLPAALNDPRALVYKDLRADQLSEIEAALARLEKNLALVLRKALERQRDAVPLAAVVAALEAHDVAQVLRLLDAEPALIGFRALEPTLQDGVYAAGALTAVAISEQLRGAEFVFGRLNPRLITWLQKYSLGLIRQIGDVTREAIRVQLLDGMTAGANPKAVAVRIKGAIGLTDRQAQAVANYRRELETFHDKRSAGGYNLGGKIDRVNGTQVLRPDVDGTPKDGVDQRRLRDFRYDGQLQRAMSTGAPLKPDQIDRMVDAYERKYLAYRARTIARTEATRANNHGIQEAWQQAIDQGAVDETLVRRQWIVARDERTCAACGPVPSLNPKRGVKVDQPFATDNGPVFAPPLHPNCRCGLFIRRWEREQLDGA